MRLFLAIFILGSCFVAKAHIGSPNVFLEDKAGVYPVRVVIRPPEVVPGLAEITVRVQGPVQRVSVLPVFWKAGREGSPSPDDAKLVRGETNLYNLYSAELWLMTLGAYSVDVTVEGPQGRGTLIVPVNSMATNTRPMPRGYALMLSAMALLLILGGLKIAGAIVGESRLAPGVLPTRKDKWMGRAAMLLATLVFSIAAFAGKKWWDAEDLNYRNNALYKPFPVSAQVREEHDQPVLILKVDASERRGKWTPLIPDHGKLMHLFLVRDGDPSAFAHLHPVQRSDVEFAVPLPPLPAGSYHVYADVTHEDGFSVTLTANVKIPTASLATKALWMGKSGEVICSAEVAQALATKLVFPPDPDDSWQMESGGKISQTNHPAAQVAHVGGGYKMVWENPGSIAKNLDASLQFKLLNADNQLAQIDSYMGMLGHAVVRRQDGKVFAHVHPSGTFSMAAQEFFLHGKTENDSTLSKAAVHVAHTNQVGVVGEISFPYAFPETGSYRIWVQMKSQGRILTGVFDTTVATTIR